MTDPLPSADYAHEVNSHARGLGTTSTETWGISGGGHMGIEVFGAPWMAYAVEVGGQGNVHGDGIDAGASIMGVTRFYVGAW